MYVLFKEIVVTYINLSLVTNFLLGISVHNVSCFSGFLCGTLPLDITLLLCTSMSSAGTSQIDSNHISRNIKFKLEYFELHFTTNISY